MWVSPNEWTIVLIAWLLLFGGSLVLGSGLLWRGIRDRIARLGGRRRTDRE